MNKQITKSLALLTAAGITALSTLSIAPAHATAFAAWEVANVPWGDVLNVRKYPSPKSRKQAAYPNGTVLQMTGVCTGGVDLQNIAGAPHDWQASRIRYRWCQVWHDPANNGDYVTGWVYGKYLYPH
ncbi:MAG: SH3 domain-containing protein [Rhizobiaceae bacterium]